MCKTKLTFAVKTACVILGLFALGVGAAAAAPSAGAATAPPAPAPAAATAPTPTSALITPLFAPDRLGARATLTFTIGFAGGAFDVPSPVHRATLRFPAGMSLDIPTLRSCSAARLRRHGPAGCPAQSQIGRGHARIETHEGSQIVAEDVELWVYLGPFRALNPSFEILGQGYTPLEQRMVFSGAVLPAQSPYGEELQMTIPPIPALPFEPDAALISFSLTVGGGAHGRTTAHKRYAARVLVPSSCPAGGFPFAASFTYANGSTSAALATASCPR